MSRREFLQLMGIAAASGMALNTKSLLAQASPDNLYDIPKFGNVHFLHFTTRTLWFRLPLFVS